jgi:hypothetical protein
MKEQIIEIVKGIDNAEFLNIIHQFVKAIKKKADNKK